MGSLEPILVAPNRSVRVEMRLTVREVYRAAWFGGKDDVLLSRARERIGQTCLEVGTQTLLCALGNQDLLVQPHGIEYQSSLPGHFRGTHESDPSALPKR